MAGYVARCVDRVLPPLWAQLPALMLTGPRGCGKTTTAARYAATVVRLDEARTATAFLADPDAALHAYPEPLTLDEFQQVPGLLPAVKRAIDADPRPGRFLLTGSVDARFEPEAYAATGRIVEVRMHGLTQRELVHRTGEPGLIDRVAGHGLDGLAASGQPMPNLGDYVELALAGTLPEPALRLTGPARTAWLVSYLDGLFLRDVRGMQLRVDPARLRRYFEAVSLNTAGVLPAKTLYDAAGIDARTALAYDALLDRTYLMDQVAPWAASRQKRLVRLPKRYVSDPALAAAALDLDVLAVLADGDLLGRVLDTFVAGQLRPELDLSLPPRRLYHARDRDGRHEVDLIVDLGARGLIAIEVKATASPTSSDAKHLVWLRDQLGSRFVAGLLLHTGIVQREMDDRIVALPICALWA